MSEPVLPGAGPGAGARPLTGIRVLVPRGPEDGATIAAHVRSLGGDPVLVPLLTTEPLEKDLAASFTAAVARWNAGAYDWCAVTSARGAEAFVAAGAMPERGGRIAAVGPATAEVLTAAGFTVAVMPTEYTGEALGEALVRALDRQIGARVLLPLSHIAAPTLEQALLTAGHLPDRVTAYLTVVVPADPARDAEIATAVDAALVLSGSCARALHSRFPELFAHVPLAAIGSPTAAEISRLGRSAPIIATIHSARGTVDALAATYLTHSSHPSLGASE